MTPARVGALAALVTLALDQATKLGLLYGADLPLTAPIRLAPFAELVVVWNRGISYGLFQQRSDLGRWLLVGLSVAAAVGLAVWIAKAQGRGLALSLGLVLGGALGNAVDRAAYGAVFDFVHLFAGGFSWYVFNVADAAIVFGVAGLLLDGLLERRRAPA